MAHTNPFLTSLLPPFIFTLLITSYLIKTCNGYKTSNMKKHHKHLFKGMFVFGTSVVDNGNNNNLVGSIAKANYLPYGIDFPFGSTGRFCNGKNVADIIGDLLHLPLIPSFLEEISKGCNIIHGVNFGSGGSGILDDTGAIAGGVINLNQQIKFFEEVTLPKLKVLLGHKSKAKISKYLFLIAEGNNDFELNYLLQPSSSRPSVPTFVANLISTFQCQLQRLYNHGARKFVLLPVYAIGCNPVIMAQARSQGCVQLVNKAAHHYNVQLIKMVDEIKSKMPGSEFVVINAYKIARDIIKDPIARGFRNATSPCCELKELIPGIGLSCKPGGKVCKHRSKFVFFDGQHLTEAVNTVIATKTFSSNSIIEAYPFNLTTLALL